MSTVLVKALSLVAIIAIGQAIKRAGWVGSHHFPLFSTIVLRITLPCALAASFNAVETTMGLFVLILIGVVVNVLQQGAGLILGRTGGREAQAFAVLNIGSYNMGAFATPYLAGFMGPHAIVYASMFDVGNSLQAAGVGYGTATALVHQGRRAGVVGFLRRMFSSVIFDVYLALVVMRLLQWQVPEFLLYLVTTIGNANTFLAMLMIGIGLELRLTPAKYRAAAKLLGTRYAFAVLFTLVTVFVLPLSGEIRTVLCMVYFAPIAAMTSGFTSETGGDVELSTFMTGVSILVAIVAMPVIGLAGPLLGLAG